MATDWITTKAAVELSGYNPIYLRELIRTGKIKGQKWGRDWQVSTKSLLAYMQRAGISGDKRMGAKKKKV
jgi:hypothetical protein